MRAVLQRVRRGRVTVSGRTVAEISLGYVILVGVGPGDSVVNARSMAEKIAHLRVFEDEQGKMNCSILDVKGEALVVSQFTLYADTHKGRRPSFVEAASPEVASPLVDLLAQELRSLGLPSQTGEFGAHMLVEIENDGPVTILLEL